MGRGRREVNPNLDALNAFVAKNVRTGFQWHTNDCLMFTNNAWKVMYGHGWADDWLGKYVTDLGLYMRASQLAETFKAQSLPEALDNKSNLKRTSAKAGCLVVTDFDVEGWELPQALGICNGIKGLFLTKKGIRSLPMSFIKGSWTNA